MDKSLNFYINYANEMQNLFVKNGINTSITKLKTNINEMNIHIKNIQAITKKLIDVSNIANELVLQKKKNINLDKMDKLDNSSELKPISKLFKQINPIKSIFCIIIHSINFFFCKRNFFKRTHPVVIIIFCLNCLKK